MYSSFLPGIDETYIYNSQKETDSLQFVYYSSHEYSEYLHGRYFNIRGLLVKFLLRKKKDEHAKLIPWAVVKSWYKK